MYHRRDANEVIVEINAINTAPNLLSTLVMVQVQRSEHAVGWMVWRFRIWYVTQLSW